MINKFIKNVALLAALFGYTSALNMHSDVNTDKTVKTSQTSCSLDVLKQEHAKGSIIVTLTNTYSKEIAKDTSKIESIFNNCKIDIKNYNCLTKNLIRDNFEDSGEDSHLQFIVNLCNDTDENLIKSIKKLSDTGNFDSVTPDYVISQCGSFTENSLNKTVNGALLDLDVISAWNTYGTGSSSVKVGVIDGKMFDHKALNINRNLARNFVSYPEDDEHAVAMAGVIGANGNAEYGYSGVCRNCTIVPLVVIANSDYEKTYSGLSSNVIQAIDYANSLWETSNKISVLNYSFSGYGNNDSILTAIKSFPGTFVWSAGNEGRPIPMDRNYYDCPNLLSVGGCDEDNTLTSNTNYYAVNVFAPGYDRIYSTGMDDTIRYMEGVDYTGQPVGIGTSIAASFVSGTAALIYSAFPGITARIVKQAIQSSAENISTTVQKLNIKKALDKAKSLYNSVKNSYNPIQIEVLEKNVYLKCLISNLSSSSKNITYTSKTVADSDVSNISNYNGDKTLTIPSYSSKIVYVTRYSTNKCVAVRYFKNKYIEVTYIKDDATSQFGPTSGGTSYYAFNEYKKSYSYTDLNDYVFSDSSVSPLTFDVLSSSGFFIKSWKIKIHNNMSVPVRVDYNTKMCFLNDAKNWSGLKDVSKNNVIDKYGIMEVDIAGNGTAGSIALSIYYVDSTYGFVKRKVTAADGIKKNATPSYNYNLITY